MNADGAICYRLSTSSTRRPARQATQINRWRMPSANLSRKFPLRLNQRSPLPNVAPIAFFGQPHAPAQAPRVAAGARCVAAVAFCHSYSRRQFLAKAAIAASRVAAYIAKLPELLRE